MYKRYSIVLVTDENDNVLVGRRNDSMMFTNPGGGAEKDECPFHCAVREFKEETGVNLQSVKLIKCFFTEGKRLIYLFKGKMPENYEFDTSEDPDEEVSNWEFKDPIDIIDELHVPIEHNELIKYWMDN